MFEVGDGVLRAGKLIQLNAILNQSYRLTSFVVFAHGILFKNFVTIQAGFNEVSIELLLGDKSGWAITTKLRELLRFKDDRDAKGVKRRIFLHLCFYLRKTLHVLCGLQHHCWIAAILQEICHIVL